MQQLYSTGEVARLLGIQQHRIVYAISTDRLPEVKCHFLEQAVFRRRRSPQNCQALWRVVDEGGAKCFVLNSGP